MNRKRFPKFAPLSLQEEITRITDYQNKNESLSRKHHKFLQLKLNTYQKLCTHPNMETVWRRLLKREPIRKNHYTFTRELTLRKNHVLDYAEKIYSILIPTPLSKLPVEKRRKKIVELLEKTNDLADELEKYDIGNTILFLIDPKMEKIPQIFGIDNFTHCPDPRKTYLDFFDFPVSISDVLRTCASFNLPLLAMIDFPISQPNRKNADAILFVRKLAAFHQLQYGKSLYEITALVSDVFYPDFHCTEKKVKNLLVNH